jgi:site-specific DNA recombinase
MKLYIGIWHFGKSVQLKQDEVEYNLNLRKQPTRTSRARPRSEWARIDLPDLRLIDDATWRRVQQQLDRNRHFNPRRSKHPYLLSGLVKCAACGRSFIGKPQHHAFRYRCAGNCGKVSSVREEHLDEPVWETVKGLLVSPRLIKAHLAELEKLRSKSRAMKIQIGTDYKDLVAGIEQEETRIIAAYRTGRIDADQLARELNGLAGRKKSLSEPQPGEPREKTFRALASGSRLMTIASTLLDLLTKLA